MTETEEPNTRVIEWRPLPDKEKIDQDVFWIELRDEIRSFAHRNPGSENWAVLEDRHLQWHSERDDMGRPVRRVLIEKSLVDRKTVYLQKLNLLSPTKTFDVVIRQGRIYARWVGPLEPGY